MDQEKLQKYRNHYVSCIEKFEALRDFSMEYFGEDVQPWQIQMNDMNRLMLDILNAEPVDEEEVEVLQMHIREFAFKSHLQIMQMNPELN